MKNNQMGLSDEQVRASKEKYGDNSLNREKKKGFVRSFFQNLSDPIIRILLIALVIEVVFTFGNCNFFEIGGIVFAIVISTGVSTFSEYRSEKAFEKLREDGLSGPISVRRNGKIERIPINEVVVGDMIYLSTGEKIPADGRIIDGELSVDQSALNGESVEVRKRAKAAYSFDLSEEGRVFRGSVIMSGGGVMIAERVGESTFYGMVAKDVQTETRESPLKLRLSRLASQISKIGYVVALIVGLSFLFNTVVVDNGFDKAKILLSLGEKGFIFSTLIRALTLMITVVVVAAPEGLPMMITVVLSANMKKMLSDKILVKKLIGIETAGSLNILFTDKTGTITVGKPECDRIITANGQYKTEKMLKESSFIYKILLLSAKYNTDIKQIDGELIGGNATDRSIYGFFKENKPDLTVKNKIPFSSDRKYSLITMSDGQTVIKGAPELIFSKAKYSMSENGERIAFDKPQIYQEYLRATGRGERVVAVAISDKEEISELTFVALIVMKDKIRRGVKEAVREVTGAGIQIVMITGDSKETAVSVAREAGFYSEELLHIALDATELHKIDDEELKKILPRLRVVSRALPRDKSRLVRVSQELELVVGMTGDGINDAPSLKLADVGFSMGSGTDIAKGASDIVILDNSFTAICKTTLYGRTIFKSIRKFITFQLIMNLVASGVSLIGQFIGIDTPITIIQMLWVNIIMDTLGGLAFAGEPPLGYYMKEKPKRRDEPILSSSMLNQIFFSGMYTLVMCIGFLVFEPIKGIYKSEESFYTAFYALFIFFGIVNCFLTRCERLNMFSNIGKNKLFALIMLLISSIQIAMIYMGGSLFRCVALTYRELSFAVLISLTVIPFEMIRRVVYRLK